MRRRPKVAHHILWMVGIIALLVALDLDGWRAFMLAGGFVMLDLSHWTEHHKL